LGVFLRQWERMRHLHLVKALRRGGTLTGEERVVAIYT
jgi:hypothetical protein